MHEIAICFFYYFRY